MVENNLKIKIWEYLILEWEYQIIIIILQNYNQYPTTPIKNIYTGNNLIIFSQFQRANNQISLGLLFQSQNQIQQCQLMINKNSFGLNTI